ncbi:MAG: hypothetical protein DWQ36_10985 [Acidobacteria bacterium]|nr:MAG: hypothetical protein DWQ30_12415 [Acidobacteriota bacterium]REK07735.1 MAG: hypothetical protein DWQ36_10985 [Acidobacteriota bacterium]
MSEPRDLEALRRAFAQVGVADRGDDPIDAGRLWDAVSGEASESELEAVLARLASEPERLEEWRLAVALHEEMQQHAASPHLDEGPAKGWAARHRGLLALAAGLLLALALTLAVASRFGQEPQPVYRSAETPEVLEALGPPDGRCFAASAAEQPCVLSWSAGDASRWRVELTDGELEPLDRQIVDQPRYRVPEETVRRLAPTTIYWQATPLDGDRADEEGPTFALELLQEPASDR